MSIITCLLNTKNNIVQKIMDMNNSNLLIFDNKFIKYSKL